MGILRPQGIECYEDCPQYATDLHSFGLWPTKGYVATNPCMMTFMNSRVHGWSMCLHVFGFGEC